MYELKMSLFDNVDIEEFLMFIKNFKITLEASGTLSANAKFQYLHTPLRGESLHEFDTFCIQIKRMTITHLNQVILGLVTYFS